MSRRLSALAASLLFAAACSKAGASDQGSSPTPSPGPSTGAVSGTKIAVPGGAPVIGGSEAGARGAVEDGTAKGGGAMAAPNYSPDNDSSYKIVVVAPKAMPVGGSAIAEVTVVPGAGFKMNREFPTKLVLTPPAEVSVDRTSTDGSAAKKLDDHELRFDVGVTGKTAGTYTISGELKFAVCTADTCDPKKRPVQIAVTVQ